MIFYVFLYCKAIWNVFVNSAWQIGNLNWCVAQIEFPSKCKHEMLPFCRQKMFYSTTKDWCVRGRCKQGLWNTCIPWISTESLDACKQSIWLRQWWAPHLQFQILRMVVQESGHPKGLDCHVWRSAANVHSSVDEPDRQVPALAKRHDSRTRPCLFGFLLVL